MYAFDQRDDTVCVDEPLYGYYLARSGAQHPGRDDVVQAMNTDGRAVVAETILGQVDQPVLFCKQMAHHLEGLDWAFLARTVNVLLIRDPREVLPTLTRQLPHAALADTGYATQVRLLDYLDEQGNSPVVLDARELLLNPEFILRGLCTAIEIPFRSCMLSWPAGPKPCDGVWAEHWYHNVHRSTGFAPYRAKTAPLRANLQPLYDQCAPLYRKVYARALRATRADVQL